MWKGIAILLALISVSIAALGFVHFAQPLKVEETVLRKRIMHGRWYETDMGNFVIAPGTKSVIKVGFDSTRHKIWSQLDGGPEIPINVSPFLKPVAPNPAIRVSGGSCILTYNPENKNKKGSKVFVLRLRQSWIEHDVRRTITTQDGSVHVDEVTRAYAIANPGLDFQTDLKFVKDIP